MVIYLGCIGIYFCILNSQCCVVCICVTLDLSLPLNRHKHKNKSILINIKPSIDYCFIKQGLIQ